MKNIISLGGHKNIITKKRVKKYQQYEEGLTQLL